MKIFASNASNAFTIGTTGRHLLLTGMALSLCIAATCVRAQVIDTVNWAPDSTQDGTGTGTLGGTNTVVYHTYVGGSVGILYGLNWDVCPATSTAVGTGATNLTGGSLGATTGSALQTISFSASVTNPILYMDFTDATTTMTFTGLNLTLLDSNNAQLVGGNTMEFAGSSNSFGDGFAAQINGTFGPGDPITFNYTTTAPFDSVIFTIGAAPVPEPGVLALLTGMTVPGMLMLKRRYRK